MNQRSDTSQSPARWVHVLPLCLYTLLSLIMTYPLILHLRSHVAGAGGDAFTFVWNLSWVKKALLDPDLSVFYTDYLYYPARGEPGAPLPDHSQRTPLNPSPADSWSGGRTQRADPGWIRGRRMGDVSSGS